MRIKFAHLFVVIIALLSVPALFRAGPSKVPVFVEEIATPLKASVYTGKWHDVGGGASTFDCNDDGYPDLLLAGGDNSATFFRNKSTKGGELKFEAQVSGLEMNAVTGAYPIDINSDSIIDIVVLRVGENVVMRGKGACKFERANEAWGFDGGDGWSTALAATWEHGAKWPSIAIGNYVDRKVDLSPWGSCSDNWLHRPDVTGAKFAAPLALKPSFCPLSMLFTDWNNSGTPSLRVSNDREFYEGGSEQMWHVDPGQAPALYTEKEGWKRLEIWGMGIASYDLDFDGMPEYFLTSMADHKLQTIAAPAVDGKQAATFKDIAFLNGVTVHRPTSGDDLRSSTGWHAQFEDVNNDGLQDLFVAKGNVNEMPDFAQKDPNNLLIQQENGSFVDQGVSAGVASTAPSRGAQLVDFNLDGLIDLVVVNHNAPAQIWRNTSRNAGHFIAVKLSQEGTNRDGIGAWLEVKREGKIARREITIGGGHASGSVGLHHIGLGDATEAEVRVVWPDGKTDEWQKVKADAFYVMEPGKAAVAWAK